MIVRGRAVVRRKVDGRVGRVDVQVVAEPRVDNVAPRLERRQVEAEDNVRLRGVLPRGLVKGRIR